MWISLRSIVIYWSICYDIYLLYIGYDSQSENHQPFNGLYHDISTVYCYILV